MNKHILLILLPLAVGCSASGRYQNYENSPGDNPSLRKMFTLPQQVAPPNEIQSIQLYRKGNPVSSPIIKLTGNDQLILEFDHLDNISRQFKASFSHRDSHWNESALAPGFYLSGFNETYFSGGLKSFSQRPSYRHYSFTFPDKGFSFKISGNYMLYVYDYDSNELLFSLPFFVTEDKGKLDTRVEHLYARRNDLRKEDQLFSQYQYPEFVSFPNTDLSFQYVQNQFWGRTSEVDFLDTATPGAIHFHLGQDQAFVGDYEFNILDLKSIEANGKQVLSIDPSFTPPKVDLRRDIQIFNNNPRLTQAPGFGRPRNDRNAGYANVQFSLETETSVTSSAQIYLVGDFNDWTIKEQNRMSLNLKSDLWEGQALIKQGEYAYTYVMLNQKNVERLALDRSFTLTPQEYLTFVYFRDPTHNYYRLLKVNRLSSR